MMTYEGIASLMMMTTLINVTALSVVFLYGLVGVIIALPQIIWTILVSIGCFLIEVLKFFAIPVAVVYVLWSLVSAYFVFLVL